jgi:glycosyltransferase involved in cell wall biosynthesis
MLNKIIHFTSIILQKLFNKLEGLNISHKYFKTDLVILDDLFPHPLSLFRYIEFDTYINNFNALAITTGESLHWVVDKKNIEFFIEMYPKKDKVQIFNGRNKIKAKIAIMIFLNNAYAFLPYIEKNEVPFVFTLYPGGGFILNDEDSDAKLSRVLSSSFFRKVIVTQNVTREYLLKNSFCKNERIEFIYGVPTDWSSRTIGLDRDKKEKNTFDVCFVAGKYTDTGRDKGYDIFIDVAMKLSLLSDKFRFHVVGGFSKNDIPVSGLSDKLKFYGYLKIDQLKDFFYNQDIILSPNRANELSKGAFDGFPTGSVVEAGLCGVVMFVTDELHQNIAFTDGRDCVFINHDADYIVSRIMELYIDPIKLKLLSQEGLKTLQKVFSRDNQLEPRLKLVASYL